jgi:sugar (pentulose or hexulose) kinase
MSAAGIVLNLGLKSIRAIVFDATGRKLAMAARPVHTIIRDDWVEQDPAEWWTLAVECLREVQDFFGHGHPILTVTASSACLVPVDKNGTVLRRSIMVSDRRSIPQAARLGALSEFKALATRNPTFTADPYFMLPKAMWMMEMEPELWAKTAHLLTPADFLVQQLCGATVTDPLNAEKFYHTPDGYPSALLSRCGIDSRLLPKVVDIGTDLGAITTATAATTGLSPRSRVLVSTYDAICAFWGSGVASIGDVADVSGTVTSVRALVDIELPPSESRVFSQVTPGVAARVVGGSNNLGGGLIEWLKQSFYPGDELAYERMEHEAAECEPTARGLLFLPYLLGERCPVWDTEARGVLFGLERHHGRPDVARAVLESAAFSVQHILSILREHGASFTRLRVSGGLSRIAIVNRIKADVTQIPVEVVAEFETTALGAFVLAGTGARLFGSIEDASALVRVREVILPDTSRQALYAEWFDVFLETYRTLRPLFRTRSEFKRRHFVEGLARLENL